MNFLDLTVVAFTALPSYSTEPIVIVFQPPHTRLAVKVF